jgi:hypothetical protein
MEPELNARIIVNEDGGPLNPREQLHEHKFGSRSGIGAVGRYRRICEEIVAKS